MNVVFFTRDYLNNIASAVLILTGLYFTFRFRFVQIKGICSSLKHIFNDKNALKMFASSLAGAAGVGNIVGVSSALFIGGAGSVFWMWIAAFFGMAVKYAETRLSVIFAEKRAEYIFSPMNYIENAFNNKILPVVFAVSGIAVSLLMGDLVQSNALGEAFSVGFGINGIIAGIIFGFLIFSVVSFGLKGVGSFAEKIVPVMTVLYIVLCFYVLIVNAEKLPKAFAEIFRSAFNTSSAIGGFCGSSVIVAFRTGTAKGIFSNESGLGSAGFSYGIEKSIPEKQGELAVFDVFVDTVIVSTASALVLLTDGGWVNGESVVGVFGKTAGNFGLSVGSICVILFAFASMTVWAYFGEVCFAYISYGRYTTAFRIVFSVCTVLGTVISNECVWAFSEIANAIMMAVNISALIKLRKK